MEDQLVILVVEDDREIQTIVEDALTEGGFEPAIAPSGEEAVTLLKGSRGTYRALVVDVSLRGRMDGWEVAKHAREIDPDCQVWQDDTPTKGQALKSVPVTVAYFEMAVA